MKRFLSLVRVTLVANFGLSLIRYHLFKRKKDLWAVPLILVALPVVAGSLLFFYVKLIIFLFRLLHAVNQESLILLLAVLVAQVVVLVFGLYYVLSAFYFSRDLEILVPLPFRPFQVMLAKFSVILINEYLTMLPLLAPVLIVFGVLSRGGFVYWILAVLVYLLLPIAPLAISGLLVTGLMRLVNVSRRKDAVMIVGSLLLILMTLLLQTGLSGSHGGDIPSQDQLRRFMTDREAFWFVFGSRFPPSIWAARALNSGFSGRGLMALLGLAGSALLLLGLMTWAGEKYFYRGLIGSREQSRHTGKRKRVFWPAAMASAGYHPLRAIFFRELRLMNRTPIFLLNGMLTVFLVPLIFFVTMRSQPQRTLPMIMRLLAGGEPLLVILVSTGFMVACAALNGTASSAFSREGRLFWISKIIPVPFRQQVLAKFLHSLLVAFLGVAAASLVLVVTPGFRLAYFLPALLLTMTIVMALTAVNLLIDLARPLLDWINPVKAIKQNLNVLFGLLADVAILVGAGYLCLALRRAGLKAASIILILGLIMFFGFAALLFWLMRLAAKRYRAIEV